jgi:Putative peptidoglycan binding domain
MKRLLPLLLVALAACGAGTTVSDTAAPTTVPLTPPTPTTSSVPPVFNPPSGEQKIECDSKAIEATYGEKLRLEACTPTWAVGDTDRDSWNCPAEGCLHTRLYQLKNNSWTTTAMCDRRFPLTRYASSCYVPNVGLATIDLIPPSDVACLIWATNTLLRFVSETGCTPSKESITAELKTPCTGYFIPQELPMQKCAQGEAVRSVQQALKSLGYKTDVDGYFGSELAQKVFEFQGAKKLPQTSLIDTATWRALFPDQSLLPGTDRNKDGLVTPNEF